MLTVADVDRLADVGGRLMVSPNVEPAVISHAASKGMVTMPGVFTPTEALAAARAGATGLKFFPASVLGPAGIQAMRAILPPELEIAAVGGVSEKDFADYAKVGVRSYGLGSSIFKPGMSAAEVGARARATIEAYDAAYGVTG
jgi:2-dehydro-3-deoxyphosphogalactonate aldolase